MRDDMVHLSRRKEFVIERKAHFTIDLGKRRVDSLGIVRGTAKGSRKGTGKKLLLAIALLHELACETFETKERSIRETRNTIVAKTKGCNEMFARHCEIGRKNARRRKGKAMDGDMRHLFMEHEGQKRCSTSAKTVTNDDETIVRILFEALEDGWLNEFELPCGALDHASVSKTTLKLACRSNKISECVFEMKGASDSDNDRSCCVIDGNVMSGIVITTAPLSGENIGLFDARVLTESGLVDCVSLCKALCKDVGLFVREHEGIEHLPSVRSGRETKVMCCLLDDHRIVLKDTRSNKVGLVVCGNDEETDEGIERTFRIAIEKEIVEESESMFERFLCLFVEDNSNGT